MNTPQATAQVAWSDAALDNVYPFCFSTQCRCVTVLQRHTNTVVIARSCWHRGATEQAETVGAVWFAQICTGRTGGQSAKGVQQPDATRPESWMPRTGRWIAGEFQPLSLCSGSLSKPFQVTRCLPHEAARHFGTQLSHKQAQVSYPL